MDMSLNDKLQWALFHSTADCKKFVEVEVIS